MDECGIRGPTNNWFKNYLTNRKISTIISQVVGKEADVDSGVPTGSVYGPVGYIMYVNTVSNVVHNCKVFMYADDMCLVYASKDITEVQKCIQGDFENISKWAHDNGIILNLQKTKCMHIHSPYNRNAKCVKNEDLTVIGHTYECMHRNKFNCNCKRLDYVDKFKYLGLTIDKNFNWRIHINDICNRLRSVLSKFYQLKNVLNKKTLKIVYFALADSLMSYGLLVYGRTFITYLRDIKDIQIRLIKFLVSKNIKDNCNKDYDKLFSICKIIPIDKKVEYLIGLEYYYNEKYKVNVKNKYNTHRVRENKLVLPKITNYYGKRTSKYLVAKVFNKIDLLREKVKISKGALKKKLKNIIQDC
ncbi:unnamed protein product [Parnassius mnemosyne]|uniref:Reverse transcriptase domain-containing protein n=1 Tax=Parnassius mnemosyne TaxID=213953 RepID=A0AAV1LVX7_9NEOP